MSQPPSSSCFLFINAPVCGSDIHSYYAIIPGLSPTATEAHPVTKEKLPIIMGHEYVCFVLRSGQTFISTRFAGTIVDIGPEVDRTKFDVGQHVAMYVLFPCLAHSALAS